MFAEYQKGRTPNPDILCNREIKFNLFLDSALKLGADYVATGHYCQTKTINIQGIPTYTLKAGKDQNKDQSYFLCQLNQAQLEKTIFPIGHLCKDQVRKIATEQGLITAEKKDSQGLCFIGKVKIPDFLKQRLKPKEGDIIEIDSHFEGYKPIPTTFINIEEKLQILSKPYIYTPQNGKVVGQHTGAHYYTIGQRKGLNVGGTKEALYVIAIDTHTNHIYTGQGSNHPGLLRPGLFISNGETHWVRPDLEIPINTHKKYGLRIRYRQPLVEATLYRTEEGIYILFEPLERGIAPGQFAAWYKNDELIGSGVISK